MSLVKVSEEMRIKTAARRLIDFLNCFPVGGLTARSDGNGGIIATVRKASGALVGGANKSPEDPNSIFWRRALPRLRRQFGNIDVKVTKDGTIHFNCEAQS